MLWLQLVGSCMIQESDIYRIWWQVWEGDSSSREIGKWYTRVYTDKIMQGLLHIGGPLSKLHVPGWKYADMEK